MKNDVVLAIDLGGTKLATGLFNDRGKLIDKNVVPLAKRRGTHVGKLILEQVEKAFLEECLREYKSESPECKKLTCSIAAHWFAMEQFFLA